MAFDFGNSNEAQRSAISTTDGPLLIIAGPGTGKTYTLVKRIVYLITEKYVLPEEIMIATFTEKAAKWPGNSNIFLIVAPRKRYKPWSSSPTTHIFLFFPAIKNTSNSCM